ncbi:hypothetical protein PG301_14720 [Parageobacillus sp. G301]|nr:hypothetical protein PG301_14720 [Parageobacillus sp. G301]
MDVTKITTLENENYYHKKQRRDFVGKDRRVGCPRGFTKENRTV